MKKIKTLIPSSAELYSISAKHIAPRTSSAFSESSSLWISCLLDEKELASHLPCQLTGFEEQKSECSYLEC